MADQPLPREADELFAYTQRGHDHYWCKGCYETDCPYGPCCEAPLVDLADYLSEERLDAAAERWYESHYPWGISDPARPGRLNPCQGRCEFHGPLWCESSGGTCEEYAAYLGDNDYLRTRFGIECDEY